MKVLVSVIIPAYNSSQYISETIDSVLKQSYKHLEVIVVDDGSTDNTLQIAEKFEKYGVRVYAQKNKGACAARNYGYQLSKGEFIQFLDADDVLAPDKIEKQLNELLKYDNYHDLLIHCKWGRFRDGEEVYHWGPDVSIRTDLKPVDWLIINHMSITGCWLTHRDLIEKGGRWNEDLKRNQDGEFFSRVMLQASKVLYSNEAKVYYRSGITSSISATKNAAAALSGYKAVELIEDYIFSLEKSARTRLAVANMYQSFVLEHYIAFPTLANKAELKVKEMGGATIKLQGGSLLKTLGRIMGWKNALRLKKVLLRLK